MEKMTSVIFDKNTVEFVTVAAECCGFLERSNEFSRRKFVDTALKLLPLLYLKAVLLPKAERIDDFEPEKFVTEGDYERVRECIAAVMGEKDDYLDVFLDDMAFCDTPIRQNISESLADIYQPVKDFICVYQLGLDSTMNDALVICSELFAEFWGQRLVNVMRALHEVRFSSCDNDYEEELENEEGLGSYGRIEEDLCEGLEAGNGEEGDTSRWG